MSSGVVYRPPQTQRHECKPPMHCAVYEDPVDEDWAPTFSRWQVCTGTHDNHYCGRGEAAEPLGTVWRCPECGKYWTAYWPPQEYVNVSRPNPTWRPSTWRERRRAREANRRPDML